MQSASCRKPVALAAMTCGSYAVALVAAAVGAALGRALQKVQSTIERLEDAVWQIGTAAVSAELRQDNCSGLMRDCSRHAVQCLQQYDAGKPAIWLQRRLQSVLESCIRSAVQLNAYLLSPSAADARMRCRTASNCRAVKSLWTVQCGPSAALQIFDSCSRTLQCL